MGADPVYMHAPNLPGDGYLFYNFSVEQDDPDFLRQFVPAIERTIQFVEQNPNRFPPKNEDAADLQEFWSTSRPYSPLANDTRANSADGASDIRMTGLSVGTSAGLLEVLVALG